jgi:hypothetical protein
MPVKYAAPGFLNFKTFQKFGQLFAFSSAERFRDSNIMKKALLGGLVVSCMVSSGWAIGVTTYDVPITAIFGSGNPDGGWTVNTAGEIQLGLRAKGRNDSSYANATPNDAAGTYTFATFGGVRGPFNYEFSINSGVNAFPLPLVSYSFFLAVDNDPSAGTSYTVVNPLGHWGDNSFGNNSTANGAGVEPANVGEFVTFPTIYNIAQNSQNITFGDYPGGGIAQPGPADATYSYELFAVALGGSSTDARLASVGITVVVGQGGSVVGSVGVPDAGSTLTLLGLGMVGLMGFRFWKR